MENRKGLTSEILLNLYYSMKKIRMTEERIEANYREDNMHTPVHLYIGQEAVASGVCANLKITDEIFSNHRNHGHYIAKGGNLNAMIAELHNKETGCSKGHGGSMHLVDNQAGIPITSSIVAGGVPIGTGSALAASIKGEDTVSVAFFGDAASEEGVVYESMCFAVLKNLPVVYICENNFYSVCTHLDKREKELSIYEKFEGILPTIQIDGNDVVEVYNTSKAFIEKARNGGGPSFIECVTYRMKDHHDVKTGVEVGYRSQEEWDSWAAKCPIKNCGKYLYGKGILTEKMEVEFEKAYAKELDKAFCFAENSNLPSGANLYNGLWG